MCIHDDSGKVFSRKMKAFPFTEGEGLEKVLEGLGYKANLDISNKKIKIIQNQKLIYCLNYLKVLSPM